MSQAKRHIVVTGGGTGGHIMPALAVIDVLHAQGHMVTFIGSTAGPERSLVEATGLAFYGIAAGKLRRYIDFQNLTDSIRVVIGTIQAWLILRRLRPQVVFAKGGYVTVPVVYAASWLGIPVVAHESDVVMGLANRLASQRARLLCTGFPVSMYPAALRSKLRFTGSPIRAAFLAKPASRPTLLKRHKLATRPTLLVMGGSQGARPINQLVTGALASYLKDWQVIHLTGAADYQTVCAARQALAPSLRRYYVVADFVHNELPDYMALADLVVTRSSANVLAELAIMAKPAILIPLPSSASDHQRANAKRFAEKEAAVVLEESQLDPEKLYAAVDRLLADTEKRQELSRAIRQFAAPEAAAHIAEVILSVATD